MNILGKVAWSRPSVILTAAATALSFAVALLCDPSQPNICGILFYGLLFALAIFASIWCCIGRQLYRFFTFTLATSAIGLVIMLAGSQSGPDIETELFFFPFAIGIPVVLVTEFIKLIFGHFEVVEPESRSDFKEGIQFNIRHIIILTTCVAAGFGFWNASADEILQLLSSNPIAAIMLLAISGTIAVFTLSSIWSMLGHMRTHRFIFALAISSIAIYLGSQFAPNDFRLLWTAMFGVCWLAQATLLLCLRSEGYRFVKRKQSR